MTTTSPRSEPRLGRPRLKGGAGYMRDEPYEKSLRDTRIFPIFEGANDVLAPSSLLSE
jgi:acyl-CoA dehydrogenase family member 9